MDIFNFRNTAWINLGLLRIGLGRFLVLGSSWKCFFNAVANINCIVALYCSVRKKSITNILGGYIIYYNIHPKYCLLYTSDAADE